MFVLIDIDSGGNKHFIETDPEKWPLVMHPDGSGPTGVDKMLLHHDAHPEDREKGGWHVINQLDGEDRPYSRWDRLCRACNHPDAHPQARALKLGVYKSAAVEQPKE